MRTTAIRLIVGSLLLGPAAAAGQDKPPAPAKGPKGDPEKVDQGAVARALQQAFDAITDLSQTPPTGKEAGQLFDHAKTFYRDAVKAYPTDPRRARVLADAANDAVRGLLCSRRSGLQPVPGLPEPPADPDAAKPVKDGVTGKDGPWTHVLDAFNRLRDPIANGGTLATGVSKDFFDEAARVYREGRKAYDAGDYWKAGELAKAAGAWLSVMNRLESAGGAETAPPRAPGAQKGEPLPPAKE
ncbi:hypothetical protein [Frigoriglobus tundricola]|uniref:Uncharacterized protein n=1 Tax=Frigoriglobus tundricola TaxID=2774151 RepID=A0A6M5YIQ7_9BACT|nr:hypothetical protein [Frigoriglobus tundricola]QJW93156.1 hypothetical protein FTUN_0661 [Frigoriglobus tundricola]